jgi:hypothetical protein
MSAVLLLPVFGPFRLVALVAAALSAATRREETLSPSAPSSGMTHLLNILCDGVLIYASVTRGGLAVSRGLAFISGKTG